MNKQAPRFLFSKQHKSVLKMQVKCFLLLLVFLGSQSVTKSQRKNRRTTRIATTTKTTEAIPTVSPDLLSDPHAHCLLITADLVWGQLNQGSYLRLGNFSIGQDFKLQFEVFPDRISPNGILVASGSEEKFEYFYWKTKAVTVKYFVVEFVYSALGMLLKALNQQQMVSIEVEYNCPYFKPPCREYTILDAKWHTVTVERNSYRSKWFLQIDNVPAVEVNVSEADVSLNNTAFFLGGRPGFSRKQFRGVIRNVFMTDKFHGNMQPISLHGKEVKGRAKVLECGDQEVLDYMMEVLKQKDRPWN